MPTPTYDLIEEQVLGSAAASVTFSSIPGTYKDLVIEFLPVVSTATTFGVYFNSDTNTNYSMTTVYGDGSSAASARNSNASNIRISYVATSRSTNTTTIYSNVMSYANSNVNKTVVSRDGIASEGAGAQVGLWRSTAAITSLTLVPISGGTIISANTVVRLWGVAG